MSSPPHKHLSREEADSIELRNHQESPLLRLPGEIRNHIYGYVLGGKVIPMNPGRECFHLPVAVRNNPSKEYHPKLLLDLQLLEVCQQIRSETHLLPISLNDFFFRPNSVGVFLNGLTNAQRDAITNLVLPGWSMPDSISHFLANPGKEDTRRNTAMWEKLGSINQMRGLKHIVVKYWKDLHDEHLNSLEKTGISDRLVYCAGRTDAKVTFESYEYMMLHRGDGGD